MKPADKRSLSLEDQAWMMVKTMSPMWPETAWLDFESPEYWRALKAIASTYGTDPLVLSEATRQKLQRIHRLEPGQHTFWPYMPDQEPVRDQELVPTHPPASA